MTTRRRRRAYPMLIAALAATLISLPRAVTTLASGGSSTWTWQNPLPQGNPLYGATCIDASTCLAVGPGGTVVRTVDGGVTWAPQPTGNTTYLNAVSCGSAGFCVAAGEGSTSGLPEVLVSADGGQSWSGPPVTGSGPLYAVSCPTATICYAGGTSSVLKTSDAGQSWYPVADPAGQIVHAMACTSATACIVGGGSYGQSISSTVDGGGSWSSINLGLVVDAISCPSAQVCFAGGNDSQNNLQLVIASTTDGGHSWQRRYTPPPPQSGAMPLRTLSCSTTTRCLAAGDSGFGVATTDGGATWSPVNLGNPVWLSALSCPTDAVCVASGAGGLLERSGDGGTTWSRSGTGGDTSGIIGASCPTSTHCFAAEYAGDILATADGRSWSTSRPGTDDTRLRGIACASATTCVAVGNAERVLRTTDGGASWALISLGSAVDLVGVSCPSASACFALGQNGSQPVLYGGVILASTDGGLTWTAENPPSIPYLYGISCASTIRCVAVGTQGRIFATQDGATWTEQAAPRTQNYDLEGVSCPDQSTCVAVGYHGVGARTLDGGATWSDASIATPSGGDLLAVACRSSSSCVAVGDPGLIYGTTDSAGTWVSQVSGTVNGLEAASCADTCWTMGSYGTILTNQPPPFTVTPRSATGVVESQAFNATVGTVAGGVSPYTASVQWGDGSTGGASIDAAGNITAGHTYLEEGGYRIEVDVTDATGAVASAVTTQVVGDAVLTVTPGSTLQATEGQSWSGRVATFADANPQATLTEYTARISWGDGTTSASPVASCRCVDGSHTYARAGSYSVLVTVADAGGSMASATTPALVADVPLSIQPGAAIQASEGQSVSARLATFTDSNPLSTLSDYAVFINWGDGTAASAPPSGCRCVDGTHTYSEGGTYRITVQVLDDGGASVSATIQATVSDAPLTVTGPTVNLLLPAVGFTSPLATATDGDTTDPISDYAVYIGWGDGQHSWGTLTGGGGTFTVSGSHAYALPGKYTIVVHVADRGGSRAWVALTLVAV